MPREMMSKVIDGSTYEFSQYGANESVRMFLRVSKIIGTPMSMLGNIDMKEGKVSIELNGGMIAEAVDALMRRADENEVLDIFQKLCSKDVLCNGGKIDFNLHYQGRLPLMFKVLYAALEVQYGNFFDAFGVKPASKVSATTQDPQT